MAQAVGASPAQKLLLPAPAEGWAWAGLEPWSGEDAIGHVVHGVRQLIKGEPIRPARPLPPLAVVGLVIGGLLLRGEVRLHAASTHF